jgi:hypothetical protein
MKKEDLRCEYSGLPSPQAYIKKQSKMKRLIQKILLWWSYKKPKKRNKSIWDL